MASVQDQKFAEALIAQGILPREKVQACLAELSGNQAGGLRLDALLVEKGMLPKQKADALAASLGIKKSFARIGGFELIEEIGRGGMGTVYRARQVSMDRLVALKVLPPRLARNRAYTERFFKEARAVAKLSHVNIIQGYDVGEASGYYYFAMEYIDGEPLSAKLAREGTISEVEALGIVEQVCRALAHAQAVAHIVHRDIKPDNIMLTKSGVAKLADLGLAKTTEEKGDISAGTPHYLSPEQARGSNEVDVRSDIYSLGATLFHMLTGTPPFTGTTAEALIEQHLNKEPPSPRDFNTSLSMGVCKLISIMMAKDPADRYQTPEDLLQDVRSVQQGIPPQRSLKLASLAAGAPRVALRKQRVSWVMPVVIAVAGIALLGGGIVLLINISAGSHPSENAVIEVEEEDPAAAELAKAEEFAAANSWKFDGIIAAYETVHKNYPQSPFGEEAQKKADEFRARRDSLAEASFNDVKAKADAMASQERYFQAVGAWKEFPPGFRFGRWSTAAGVEVKRLTDKGRERAREVQAQAEALAGKERYPDAIKLIEGAYVFGFEQTALKSKAEKYRKLMEEMQHKAVATEAERARKEYAVLVVNVVRLEYERRFEEALELCKKYLAANKAAPDEARELRTEVETARQVWTDAFGGLKKLVGSAVEIRARGIMLRGELRRISDTTFTIENATSAVMTRNLSDIDPENWLSLAGVVGNDTFSVKRQALFLLAIGAREKAEQTIASLGDDGLLADWKERMQKRQEILDANQGERFAAEILEQARALAAHEEWKELYLKLSDLRRDYAETVAYANARKAIDEMFTKAGAGLANQPGLQHLRPGDIVRLLDGLREFNEWQKTNECPKTVPCETCHGTGTVLKTIPCSKCKGTGKITCPRCGGRKVEPIPFTGGTRLCPECQGEGKVRCTQCGGKGQTTVRRKCPECEGKKGFVCPICHGTGYKEDVPQRFIDMLRSLQTRWKVNVDDLQAILKE